MPPRRNGTDVGLPAHPATVVCDRKSEIRNLKEPRSSRNTRKEVWRQFSFLSWLSRFEFLLADVAMAGRDGLQTSIVSYGTHLRLKRH